jgi:hypothetical protein
LLEAGDLVPKGVDFAQRKEFGEKCIGTFLPSVDGFAIGIEPLLRLPK